MSSLSSQLMTTITEARNPYGNEENWLSDDRKIMASPSWIVLGAAAAGYLVASITAVVETALSACITLFTFPFTLSAEWLESSAFSIAWALSYLTCNVAFPHLRTEEESARTFIFDEPWLKIAITTSLHSISERFTEISTLPSFITSAYELRSQGSNLSLLERIRTLSLAIQDVHQIVKTQGFGALYSLNAELLSQGFTRHNTSIERSHRPLLAYFVSSRDHNGVLLGRDRLAKHKVLIASLQQKIDVSAKVVRTTRDLFEHLAYLHKTYPTRPIRAVLIDAHGSPKSLSIRHGKTPFFYTEQLQREQFVACAPDAAIILNACSCGKGDASFAERLAQTNPGKHVFAFPGTIYVLPTIKMERAPPKVTAVTHGSSPFSEFYFRYS